MIVYLTQFINYSTTQHLCIQIIKCSSLAYISCPLLQYNFILIKGQKQMGCILPMKVSRNNDVNQAELKDTGGHFIDNPPKVIQASPIPQTNQKALEIVIKTNQVLAKSVKQVKPSEEKPYIYVQPNDDLMRQINKAAQISNDRRAIDELKKIAVKITDKNQKSLQLMQKLAFISTSLAERYAKIEQLEQCKGQELRALHIYSQFQSEYFEEIIVILNNSALRHQKAEQYDQAIDKYMTIDKLSDKYYSIHDQRRLLNMNNLACLYFSAGKKAEGKELFGKIFDKLSQHKYSSELVNLIQTNDQYYKKQSTQ